MANVPVIISRSITERANGIISSPPASNVNPPALNPNEGGGGGGVGITLNNRWIGGVKRIIETSDVLNIPPYWQYNVFQLQIDGLIIIESTGSINTLDAGVEPIFGTVILQNYNSVTEDYTLDLSDRVISVTEALTTVTLPTAQVANTGYEYKIDNSSGGNIFLVGEGGELIQSEVSQTIPPDTCINVFTNGTEWRIS